VRHVDRLHAPGGRLLDRGDRGIAWQYGSPLLAAGRSRLLRAGGDDARDAVERRVRGAGLPAATTRAMQSNVAFVVPGVSRMTTTCLTDFGSPAHAGESRPPWWRGPCCRAAG
jgi:hypothetical protein